MTNHVWCDMTIILNGLKISLVKLSVPCVAQKKN